MGPATLRQGCSPRWNGRGPRGRGVQWGDCRAADPLVPAVPAGRAGVETRDRRHRPTAVANGDGRPGSRLPRPVVPGCQYCHKQKSKILEM